MFEGIQLPHIAFYGSTIRFHLESAVHSIEYVSDFFADWEKEGENFELTGEIQNNVLNELQNILVHAASISRYFWPSRNGKNDIHKNRGKKLREVFKVSNESYLRNRKLRNHLEHFDENLDLYLSEKIIVGYIIPTYVGFKPFDDGVPSHIFRAYYVDIGEFEVLGESFLIKKIVDEIIQMYKGKYLDV